MEDKVLVVIPYLQTDAQGRELEYAVAGWRKHFKENFLIVLVGDYHPVVESGDDIVFIECPRVKWPGRGNYWAHIDHVNKFRKVREHFPDSKGFIYTCDDIYAVRDFDLALIKKPKARKREIKGSFHSMNAWVRDNYKTKVALITAGLPVINWVCHLPVYYDWDKLFKIYDEFHCDRRSYVVEQLYFNTFNDSDDVIFIEEDLPNDFQLKLWDKSVSTETLKKAIGNKYWVSNSVKGWTKDMEKVLADYYRI